MSGFIPEPAELAGAAWRKSRRSNGANNCVEVAFLAADRIAVRDSKNPHGPALLFTRGEWEAFVGGTRDGEFDL